MNQTTAASCAWFNPTSSLVLLKFKLITSAYQGFKELLCFKTVENDWMFVQPKTP